MEICDGPRMRSLVAENDPQAHLNPEKLRLGLTRICTPHFRPQPQK